MKNTAILVSIVSLGALIACGRADQNSNGPNPRGERPNSEVFKLENGSYRIESVSSISDGCGRKPMSGDTPITSRKRFVTNDERGNVSIDFCSLNGRSTSGTIMLRGATYQGSVAVNHGNVTETNGSVALSYNRSCSAEIKLVASNRLEVSFREDQSNRNQELQRVSGVNSDKCTTSYDLILSKG